ncbi:MAG TPA: hypothetical protein VER11_09310 [Polyangiaceae bacterium]|nr:hypothetical protein [Polyangiaceae bacterium]
MSACLLCSACSSNSPSGSESAGGGGSSGALAAGGAGTGSAGAPLGGSSGATAVAGAGPATSGSAGALSSGGSAGSGTSGAASGGANGVAGGAGTAGAGGGSAGPVVPVQVSGGSLYRFNSGDSILEIDAQTGGRVSKLSLSGADMMVTTASDPTTWGSVFWTSPRTKTWMPEWPPPAAIDNGPYTATIAGTHLTLTGAADTSLGVSMAKDYSVDSASGWITIKYTINSSKAQSAAPWEVSRVPRGGIAFFPLGTASSLKAGPLTVTQSGGMVWFDDGQKTATSSDGSKLVADGKDGWEAYVFGGNLFLKRFTDQPVSLQAPNGEGEICLYPGASWVEFEVQGPYTAIPASGSLPWTVQWRLVKIPSTVTVAVGSATLVSFVQQQLAIP